MIENVEPLDRGVMGRLWDRTPLSIGEGIVIAATDLRSFLVKFLPRCRITPAMRERCVDYALREGDRGGPGTIWRAQKIAEYIATGEK